MSISFHANKNITTSRRRLPGAQRCRRGAGAASCSGCRAWSAWPTALDATLPGGKHNLTDVAARVGLGQLARLEEFTARRRLLARRYFERFDRSLGCELPLEDFEHSNWHMFQIVLPPHVERGAFIAQMHAAGIGIGVHYPAIHLLSLYRQHGLQAGRFPASPSASAAASRRCRCSRRCAMQDVERVCVQMARTSRPATLARSQRTTCRRSA